LDTGRRRVSIREAAKILDVSESAIHKRVQRGTLEHDKEPDGRGFVYLDGVSDAVSDAIHHPSTEALISEMRVRIGFLERELVARSEEIRWRDAIIMNMTEAMKALSPSEQEETPPEPRESPWTAADEPEEVNPRPATGGPHEGAQRRSSWWRTWFGIE
jgi:hypothetical protein